MVASFAKRKELCGQDRDQARLHAARSIGAHLGVSIYITGWTVKARQAYADQWCGGGVKPHPDADWDWEEIFKGHKEYDRLDLAVWGAGDRLSVLGLGLVKSDAVEVRFVAGDPRPGCPLIGHRALIVLECAQAYAQLRGKHELRVQPVNERLEELYTTKFGFTLATPRNQPPSYRKEVP